MSKVEDALEHAGRQWRDEVDSAPRVAQPVPPRRPRRRWAALAVATAAAAVAVIVVTSGGGGGTPPQHPRPATDCAGARLRATPPSVRAGGQVTVRGRFYVTSCQDSATMSVPEPIASVPITLTTSDGQRTVLATAHPKGTLGTFAIAVRIPRGAPAGPATIGDGGVSPAQARLDLTPWPR